jgi:hypothetical protein
METPKRRAERLAANEAELREVNERLPQGGVSAKPLFFCECSETLCGEFVHLSQDEFADIHRDVMRFVVAPGHAKPDIETVVREGDGYHVVRKSEDVRHVVDPG